MTTGLLTVEQVSTWMRDVDVTENQLRAALTQARKNRNSRIVTEQELKVLAGMTTTSEVERVTMRPDEGEVVDVDPCDDR